jgi:hypothetical protein
MARSRPFVSENASSSSFSTLVPPKNLDPFYIRFGPQNGFLKVVGIVAIMFSFLVSALRVVGAQRSHELKRCGDAWYSPSEVCRRTQFDSRYGSSADILQFVCYDDAQLCPVIDGEATDRCGADCYAPADYRHVAPDELEVVLLTDLV